MTASRCAMPHQRLVYSLEEAAEQISISLRGLTQLIASGDIRSIKYGEGRRRVGVTHQALIEWIASREADERAAAGTGNRMSA